MVLREDNLIEKVTENKLPHEPYGWHHEIDQRELMKHSVHPLL